MNRNYFMSAPEDEMEFMPIIPLNEDGNEGNDDQANSLRITTASLEKHSPFSRCSNTDYGGKR